MAAGRTLTRALGRASAAAEARVIEHRGLSRFESEESAGESDAASGHGSRQTPACRLEPSDGLAMSCERDLGRATEVASEAECSLA